MRSAVVSGLGPNGVMAALELLRSGYHVTVVEKRPGYTRPIHLHLRESYLEDVRRLSPELHAQLMEISTPIAENLRDKPATPGKGWFRRLFAKTTAPPEEPADIVTSRLGLPLLRHVRLDAAERLFFAHLDRQSVVLRRGFILDLAPDQGRYRATIRKAQSDEPPEDLGSPDIIVLAEGGKSATVGQLGLESVRFSYPKHFMSAHVAIPFGPRTRRIDTDVRQLVGDPALSPAPVSLWACGHGDPDEGTWIVIEVPEELIAQLPAQAEEYFLEGATRLLEGRADRETIRRSLDAGAVLAGSRSGNGTFAGTFKFEQQCLRFPAAGENVVVLGDAAGMGHHALSSGLEMGACDLIPLQRLVQDLNAGTPQKGAIERYAQTVYRSRITLLALGMREYYPNLAADPLDTLHRAAELFDPGDDDEC